MNPTKGNEMAFVFFMAFLAILFIGMMIGPRPILDFIKKMKQMEVAVPETADLDEELAKMHPSHPDYRHTNPL